MAKVYKFPVKKKLTEEMEECLYAIGEAYIKTLNYALCELAGDDPTQEELDEIRNLVELSYAKGLYRAIDEMEP